MRAVKGSLGHSLSEREKAPEGVVGRAHSRIDRATPERDMEWGKARSYSILDTERRIDITALRHRREAYD